MDVQSYLILKKDGEDGPDVKGGPVDALIVHACKVQKITENGTLQAHSSNVEFMEFIFDSIPSAFGEAFITTFRTFLTPLDLTNKLIHRYTTFCCQVNDSKQRSAKESFALLVRVVNDLT